MGKIKLTMINAYFGLIRIDIDAISVYKCPKNNAIMKELMQDIAKNGLKNNLIVNLSLGRKPRFWIGKHEGTTRIWALKNLGWKKISCYIRFRVTEKNRVIYENFLKNNRSFIGEYKGKGIFKKNLGRTVDAFIEYNECKFDDGSLRRRK